VVKVDYIHLYTAAHTDKSVYASSV
jgi:hypothetical protein